MFFQNKKLYYPIKSFLFIYDIYDACLTYVSKHLDLYKYPGSSCHVIFFILTCFEEVRFPKSLLAARIWDSLLQLEEVSVPALISLQGGIPFASISLSITGGVIQEMPGEGLRDAFWGFSCITHLNTLDMCSENSFLCVP